MNDLMQILARNMAYAKPERSYQTPLRTDEQAQFFKWLQDNQAPYDPSPQSDYDMAGFWKALQSGNPIAASSVNPNDNQIHYPDYWKTPYHKSFSRESQWALPSAPDWNDKDQLVMPDGTIVYDERAK